MWRERSGSKVIGGIIICGGGGSKVICGIIICGGGGSKVIRGIITCGGRSLGTRLVLPRINGSTCAYANLKETCCVHHV